MIEWYVVDEKCDIDTEVGKFLDLMRASHPEKSGFLDDPHNFAFIQRVMPAMYANGWLKMTFLVVNGTPPPPTAISTTTIRFWSTIPGCCHKSMRT